MADIEHEGKKRPAPEFWITLALITIVTIIALLFLHDDRRDQVKY